jgi:hypothetical protein
LPALGYRQVYNVARTRRTPDNTFVVAGDNICIKNLYVLLNIAEFIGILRLFAVAIGGLPEEQSIDEEVYKGSMEV